jgi:hypothetical protein
VRKKRWILVCQEIHARSDIRPSQQSGVDDVREVALESATGLTRRLAFGDLSLKEGPRLGMVPLLDNCDPVEGGVQLTVAAAVQPVAPGCLS